MEYSEWPSQSPEAHLSCILIAEGKTEGKLPEEQQEVMTWQSVIGEKTYIQGCLQVPDFSLGLFSGLGSGNRPQTGLGVRK